MLTYNGNEMMLQNDMGNTLIQDSATGNIMGLNPGFIPTGIKEHGGIMYITSVGKDANGNPIGEIGTIPSPIIRDIYKDKITYTVNNFIPIGIGDPLTITHKLYPADKFIVNLDMKVDVSSLIGTKHYKESSLSGNGGKPSGDPSDIVLSRKVVVSRDSNNNPVLKDLYTPLISYADSEDKKVQLLQQTRSTNEVDLFSTKGVYSLDMYSTNVNGSKKVSGPLTYPQQYNGGVSKYWYLHNDEYESVFPKDLFEATLNKSLKQFPSSNKPGQLAVKLTPENIGEFGMLPRKNDPKNTPITVKWGNPTTYISFFPGFYYSTESGVYIDKLNNIKVIDESTEQEIDIAPSPNDDRENDWVGIDREIKFTNILYSPNDFQGQRWKWFDTQSVLWGDFELPQTQSQTSNNHFILSSLADITDHSQTDLVSSDASDNKKHAGLFYANLGAKYNNWYRLELDYYDQYDNLQGSFSTRFNPYINDTFGTNLDITGVEMIEGIVMGNKKTIDDLTVNIKLDKECLLSKHVYPKDDSWNSKAAPETCTNWFQVYSSDEATYPYFRNYVRSSNVSNSEIKGQVPFISGIQNGNLSYLYGDSTQAQVKIDIKDAINQHYDLNIPAHMSGSSASKLVFGNKDSTKQIKDITLSTNWKDNTDEHYFIEGIRIPNDSESRKFVTEHYIDDTDMSGNGMAIVAPVGTYSNSQNFLKRGDVITSVIKGLSGDLPVSLIKSQVNKDNDLIIKSNIENSIQLYTPIKEGENEDLNHYGYDNYQWFMIPHQGSDFKGCIQTSLTTVLKKDVKGELIIPLIPAYKITPYFLLTGTADSTSSVYPRRFVSYKKLNPGFEYIKNMPYEYNLEKIPAAFNITQDIIQVENSSYLKELDGYKQGISDVKLTLDAGIYTLNMTGVPNKLKDTATITINNTKLNIHTQGELKTESGTVIANQFYFYQPVVFMLEQRGEVTVSARDLEAFQEIGLYKVNTIDVDSIPAFIDMYTKAGGSTVCTYKEYMNSLIKTIKAQDSDGQNKELLPSERYALIQKYGIFFKEAYVFTEGLYNAKDKTINGVEIADSTNGNSLTYTAAPYIPADTSILPVNLQPDLNGYLIYTWNIYVMPDDILKTDYEDSSVSKPDFVFTNGVPEKVSPSTEPKLGNLRMPAQKVFDIDNLWGDKPKDHFGNNNAIGGMLPSVSIK